jgi:hypothetical protein
MENEEILQYLSKLEKKIDKVLSMNTKIAKALHLLPVTEKEERDLQIQMRKNLEISAKVNNQLDEMQNKNDDSLDFNLAKLFDSYNIDTYDDIIDSPN